LNEIKLYNSFDELPIYNYYELCEKHDNRFLIKDVDVFNLPSEDTIKDVNFNDTWAKILKSLPYKENELQVLYFQCQTYLMQFFEDKSNKTLQRYNDLFIKYLKELEKRFINYKFDNQTFENVFDFYKYFKSKYDLKNNFLDLEVERMFYFNYNIINASPVKKWNLYEEISWIQINFNIIIDEFRTSVTKYNNIIAQCIKKSELMQLKNKK